MEENRINKYIDEHPDAIFYCDMQIVDIYEEDNVYIIQTMMDLRIRCDKTVVEKNILSNTQAYFYPKGILIFKLKSAIRPALSLVGSKEPDDEVTIEDSHLPIVTAELVDMWLH